MQAIKITHIFILVLLLKIISLFVDHNFALLLIIVSTILFHLYITKHISFDIPFLKKSTNTETHNYNYNINRLKKLIASINSIDKKDGAPNEIKNKLIVSVNTFIDNANIIFNNDLKNCYLYIDLMNDQRSEILNIVNGYIINIPLYENYDFFKKLNHDIKITIDIIFDFLSNKCSVNTTKQNLPYFRDQYKLQSGYRKDWTDAGNVKDEFSNNNSYAKF